MESSSEIQLTRYLYVKDEVILALILSVLQKDNTAYFWAFELYYSGFQRELVNTFWSIYYDFFHTLNPSFENYLLNKLKNSNENDDDINIGNIIENFNIRSHNMDVFILREISNQFDFDTSFMSDYIEIKNYDIFKSHFIELVNSKDYLMLGFLLTNVLYEEHLPNLLESICEIFTLDREKIQKGYQRICKKLMDIMTPRRLLLSRIVQIMTNHHYSSPIKKNKNIYITINSDDVINYKTIISSMCKNINDRTLPAYKILSKVELCKIDHLNLLSLFHLKREKINKYELFERWLYYASFSPLWKKRIEKYSGIIDYKSKTVIFDDDDLLEEFSNKYDMELDEQTKIIQDSIMSNILRKYKFRDFYLNHNKNSIINIDNDILDEMDKINYKF